MRSQIRTRADIARYAATMTLAGLLCSMPMTALATYLYWGRAGLLSGPGLEQLVFGLSMTAFNVLLFAPPQAVRGAMMQRSLNEARLELARLAKTDPLTGLLNRRGLAQAAAELPRDRSVAMLLCDLDHFKKINDNFGHEAGDAVLRTVGALVNESVALRSDAFGARYGGEELAVALAGIDIEEARRWAEDLRVRLTQQPIPAPGGPLRVTMSVGLAAAPRFDGDLAPLLSRADQALYRAKCEGRNRVVADSDSPPAERIARAG